MTRLFLTALLLLSITFLTAQKTVNSYVKEGIAYHDDGDYAKAIETYKKALEIEPKSALINYEMALSYYQLADYKATVKAADVTLKGKKDHLVPALIIKGSALDVMGKTKKSIKLFEKAIEEMEPHYLIFYNLALNYFKIGENAKASTNSKRAIMENPNHTSSHFLLGTAEARLGNKVPSLLALHYFLLLEPESPRSPEAYELLLNQFGGNVTRNPDKPNNIVINIGGDMEFMAVDMMISMLQTKNSLEDSKDKTKDELFVSNTKSFFDVAGEMKEEKPENIWWTFYVPFFHRLSQSEHMEAYCKYITQSGNEASTHWLEDNGDKLQAFGDWLNNDEE